MPIFSWFKKNEPEDYEQVLASLALDIQKRQSRLSEIRLRERRTTLLITLYTIAAWAAYVGAWYAGWRPLKAIPIFVGPIIIQFSRRIAQTWYDRIGNAEEKTLKELLSKQRSKVEEIKKKTNYYSTKNLIERYDPSSASGSPGRSRFDVPPSQPQPKPQQTPTTPQRGAKGQPDGYPQANKGQSPNIPLLGPQVPPTPLVPPRKQWYDKLADALLGDDEPGEGQKNRYALICQKCFAHNGLVREELWEDTQYVCPKCGQFNPSMRALKAGHAGSMLSIRAATSPQQQSNPEMQRRSGPRMSAPIHSTGPLLQAEESGFDRRRSLPAPNLGTLVDVNEEEQAHSGARLRTRRSPLAQTISLPEDEGDAVEEGGSEQEEVTEQSPRRRRRIVVVED